MFEPHGGVDPTERRRRILIIDCDGATASHLGELFRGEGCDVYTALDETRVMQHLSEGRSSDLILFDAHVGNAGAPRLGAQLADRGVHFPVVVATNDPDPKAYAQTVGAVAYLPQPMALRDLDEFFDQLVVTGTRGAPAPGD